ncbi:MAG: adenylate kinase [Gaiellaceae bacterium]|jgi:adenylate kinase family enzyme
MPARISVAGDSGSGKTTVSRAIAARLDLPHIELDDLFHGPNWSTPPKEEFRRRVAETLDVLDGWVADGNYTGSLGSVVLERAELLVWLDLPLRVCLRRIWSRTWRRIRTREELWTAKNRETFRNTFFSRDSLFLWTLKAHFRHRREWPARFAALPRLEVVRLRTQRDVDRWLAELTVRHSPSQ